MLGFKGKPKGNHPKAGWCMRDEKAQGHSEAAASLRAGDWNLSESSNQFTFGSDPFSLEREAKGKPPKSWLCLFLLVPHKMIQLLVRHPCETWRLPPNGAVVAGLDERTLLGCRFLWRRWAGTPVRAFSPFGLRGAEKHGERGQKKGFIRLSQEWFNPKCVKRWIGEPKNVDIFPRMVRNMLASRRIGNPRMVGRMLASRGVRDWEL